MSSFNLVKYVGPRLLPFIKTMVIYFVMFIPEDSPSLFAMMIKCLPVLSLALFILLHGIGRSEKHEFSRRILTGLIFSCVGDAFLIWPAYFLHGMAAFAVAQIFYIRAFGFQPLNAKVGLPLYCLANSNLYLIIPDLMKNSMVMAIGVMVYSHLLVTMLWRAVDRTKPFTEASWTWSTFSGFAGAILFAISDTILAVNLFLTRIPYHQILIMTTYYLAQLFIALSVVTTTQEKTPTNNNDATINDLTGADSADKELSKQDKENARARKPIKSVI